MCPILKGNYFVCGLTDGGNVSNVSTLEAEKVGDLVAARRLAACETELLAVGAPATRVDFEHHTAQLAAPVFANEEADLGFGAARLS